jgi:hypothetical protein
MELVPGFGVADMTRLTIDDALGSQLAGQQGCVELCDPSGKTIGFFTPLVPGSQPQRLEPKVSEEELDRREKEEQTYSTAEVKARLESH